MASITKDQVIDFIANMSVLEMSELVKEMEEKFGVSAAAAAVAAPAAAGGVPDAPAEETAGWRTVAADSHRYRCIQHLGNGRDGVREQKCRPPQPAVPFHPGL